MPNEPHSPLFRAYVFLVRGFAHRAEAILRDAVKDGSLDKDLLEIIQDTLFIFTQEGVKQSMVFIEGNISGHEMIDAWEEAKKIPL